MASMISPAGSARFMAVVESVLPAAWKLRKRNEGRVESRNGSRSVVSLVSPCSRMSSQAVAPSPWRMAQRWIRSRQLERC